MSRERSPARPFLPSGWLSRIVALAGLGMIGFFFLFAWGELHHAKNAQARADAIKALRSLILAERLYSKDHGGAVTTIECLRKPTACTKPLPSDKPYLDGSWPGTLVDEYWMSRMHLDSPTVEGKVEKYAVTLVRKEADSSGSSFCADSEGLVIVVNGTPQPDLRDALCDRSRITLNRGSEGYPKDREGALVFFGKAADHGNLDAQSIIGTIYLNGEGAPPDYERALSWFRKAAAGGSPSGQVNLGAMYDQGQGVPKDPVQAVDWFRKASDQGESRAQYNLALKYDQGEGVPLDRMQALMWALIAIDGPDYEYRKKAADLRQRIADSMTPKESAQAQVLAFKWEEARRRANPADARWEYVADWVPPTR